MKYNSKKDVIEMANQLGSQAETFRGAGKFILKNTCTWQAIKTRHIYGRQLTKEGR